MRGTRFTFPQVLIVGWLLTSPTARADTLEAPAVVQAQQDGSFSYDVTFHKGPGTGQFAGYSYQGIDNVQGSAYADCFCLEFCPVLGPGYTYTFQVAGNLVDPSSPGSVHQDFAMCSGGSGAEATTVVRNFTNTGVGGAPAPSYDGRLRNEPNPFSSRTTFHYELAEPGPVRLSIFDLTGRLVTELVNEVQPAGKHLAFWDARGVALGAGGILFARIERSGTVQSRTLIVTR